MLKKFIVFFLFLLCLANNCWAMSFEKGTTLFFRQDGNPLIFTAPNGEKIKFVSCGNYIQLRSDDKEKIYLLFKNYDGNDYRADFIVSPIKGSNPSMGLWEIIAGRGAHGKNAGYWLIGQYGNEYVVFISLDNLENMGYTPHEWHRINTEIVDGKYIIESSHEYMPPGGQYGYQKRNAVDLRVGVDWDNNASWFKLYPM